MVNKGSQRGLKKGAWTAEEDKKLVKYVIAHGEKQWRALPTLAGLKRCGKSCRMRWLNYLRPGIKRGNFSEEEEDLIIRLRNLLGNKWSLIARRIPGRTDNEIKNHWNTHLCKRPLTIDELNKRLNTRLASSSSSSSSNNNSSSNASFTLSQTDRELDPSCSWIVLAHSQEFDGEELPNFAPAQSQDLRVEDYGISAGLDGCEDPFKFKNEAGNISGMLYLDSQITNNSSEFDDLDIGLFFSSC